MVAVVDVIADKLVRTDLSSIVGYTCDIACRNVGMGSSRGSGSRLWWWMRKVDSGVDYRAFDNDNDDEPGTSCSPRCLYSFHSWH